MWYTANMKLEDLDAEIQAQLTKDRSAKGWSKYGNKKTEYNGFTYDSKKEANRAQELDLLERAGEISDIERQVPFVCEVNGKKICTYKADFRYKEKDGTVVVEDVKGVRTGVYKLKKKLVEAIHGVKIIET